MAEEKVKVETSLMHKGRKTIWHLQQMKERGEKIVMVGPGNLDPLFTAWADAAGCDMARFVAPGENARSRGSNLYSWGRQIRKVAPNIHLNAFIDTLEVPDNKSALEKASMLLADQIDSVIIMGITLDKLEYLTKNHVPVFGHVGALSGWQTTNLGGYKRIGKTAEEAYQIYRNAYEYQECGMKGMTIELVPRQVAQKIAEKLTVPVVGVAAGAPCDGSEMVVWDLLGIVPAASAHAVQYANLPEVAIGGYTKFGEEVRAGVYPQPKHGFDMDEAEYEKFCDMVDADVH